MKKKYLRQRLCIPIKGYNRSIIYDLLRNDYYFIPNELYLIIKTNDVIDFTKVNNDNNLLEWVDFLLEKEIIFEIKNSEERLLFPNIDMAFYTPFLVQELIIFDNIDIEEIHKFESIELKNISIIVQNYEQNNIKFLLEKLSNLEVDSIYLFFIEEGVSYKYSDFIQFYKIDQLFNIYLFKCDYIDDFDGKMKPLNVIEFPYTFTDYKKKLYHEKLNINIDHFFESFNFHNYFYKKIVIDEFGNIRNGILNKQSFGDIFSVTKQGLLALITSKKFQKLWRIRKEDILICKDCEFKYMCVDSRVPQKKSNDNWFHLDECTYNPYISKWVNEEGYKSLNDCGIIIDFKRGVTNIDKEKFQYVLEGLWS